MKKVTYVLILIFVFSITIIATAKEKRNDDNSVNQTGRYQLFQGEYQFINLKGEEYWLKGLFKIDTATGKIFECRSNQFKDPKTGKKIQSSDCYEIFNGEQITRDK